MTALRITVRSFPNTKHPDEVVVIVEGSTGAGPLKTRAQETLRASMRDYLDTYVDTALASYMWGETWRGVTKDLAKVMKLARHHSASHDF